VEDNTKLLLLVTGMDWDPNNLLQGTAII